ncbi:hypothetical protein KU306_17575 (plasmid) [Haloferax larsenii]|uniref:Tat (Twin-arginine translocation) pathway signal sequence n=1 Tax=Haloferax larsenii TaxID=302484 RepID=A0ABY5RJ71_HALLR|nr:hypothetical protein [Haloferax larsenii]ELZ80471.1 hypothetical protein C455_06356 [Haloferax larsenii JCM 13917]UVE52421.1 hypothetical protein KU306_17575 [Haloferax larsenii]
MARELAHDQDRDDDGESDSSVGRRGYLGLCGTVAATGALTGFTGLGAATNRPEESSRSSDEHTLIVAGTGTSSSFEVTVSDTISPLEASGALSTTGTVGPAAEGAVDDGARSYRFTGDITDIRSSGPVSVYVDGSRIPDDAY